jgi:hypothetical protein
MALPPQLMLGVDLTKRPLDKLPRNTGSHNQKYSAQKSMQPIAILLTFRIRLERILMSIHPVADDPIGFLGLVPEEAVTAAVDDFHLGAFDVVA